MNRIKQFKKMKKTLLTVLAIFAIAFNFYAQIEPSKALKKAIQARGQYNVNPAENADKLQVALDMITLATESEETNKDAKTWLEAGKIYNDQANKDINAVILDPTAKLTNPTASIDAFNAFKNAMQLAQKKFEKKEAAKGLQETANQLSNVSNILIPARDYDNAYKALKAMDEVRAIQQENGIKITLDNPEEYKDHKFVTAYCAMEIKKLDEADKLFAELRADNYDDARIYSYGYNIAAEKQDAAAFSILEQGLAKHPDSQEILFAQINYLINEEKYDELTVKLKQAIEASPDNPSVYSALGNVYMNLHQEAFSNGDVKATEYFDDSKSYYEQAAAIDPNLFDVQYSLGSLYFNKAAEVTKRMGDLPISETKKYDMLKSESEGLFNTALPYFKKAEKLNANDVNTLIALKEIFARTNDFETSGEFKKRLENVQAGGTNDGSYFNK